jgi:putative hydrolase of the HAD superfamily
MTKAILFDFGGVITESPFDAFNVFERERGIPNNFIRTLNSTHHDSNAWARLERGEITPDQFDEIFREEALKSGEDIGGLEVLKLVFTPIRPSMIQLIQTYKKDYQVACLTNNFPRTKKLEQLVGIQRLNGWERIFKEFSYVIESAKVGYRKPEKKFFEIACSTIGVSPENTVFLDDIGSNLKPAKLMGMKTIKVTSENQAIADLRIALKEG